MNHTYKNMIPVIVGDDPFVISLAREKCGGLMHVFTDRPKLIMRLDPRIKVHRVSGMSHEIISMYLNSFANDNPEYPVLVFAKRELSDIEPFIEHNCILWKEET